MLQVSDNIDIKSFMTWEERTKDLVKGDHVKLGFFRVRTNCQLEELVELFRQWATKTLYTLQHKKRGRNPIRDWLNGLGAMRLGFCYRTFNEAKVRLRHKPDDSQEEPPPVYGTAKAMDTAADRVISVLTQLVDNKSQEFPIHWSERWSKPS